MQPAAARLTGPVGFFVGFILGPLASFALAGPVLLAMLVPDSAGVSKTIAVVAAFAFAIVLLVAIGSALGRRPELGWPFVIGAGLGPPLNAIGMMLRSPDLMAGVAMLMAAVFVAVLLLGFADGRRVMAEREGLSKSESPEGTVRPPA